MSKRNISRYALIRRFIIDPFADLHRTGFRQKWLQNRDVIKVFLRNVKIIEKRIRDKIITKIERDKNRNNYGKHVKGFFYRVDIIKLTPRRKRKTIHRKRLLVKHKIRKFVTQMKIKQLQIYLRKSRRSTQMLKVFFSLIESRLDVILYRLGFFLTSSQGRQLISHGNFIVNSNKSRALGNRHIKISDYISIENIYRPFFFAFLFYNFFNLFFSYSKVAKKYKKRFNMMFNKPEDKKNKVIKRRMNHYNNFKLRKNNKMFKRKKRVRKNFYVNNSTLRNPFFFGYKIYIYIYKKFRFLKYSGWKNRIYRNFFFRASWLIIKQRPIFYKYLFIKHYMNLSIFWQDNKWVRFYAHGSVPTFKITSLPSYLESNFRIMVFKLSGYSNYNDVFFPFKINKLKLPSLSYKFR